MSWKDDGRANVKWGKNSFGGLETNERDLRPASVLSTRCWCAACAVLHSGTPPLHSPLSSSRTEPNQTPRRSALSVVEQCHERQQRLPVCHSRV